MTTDAHTHRTFDRYWPLALIILGAWFFARGWHTLGDKSLWIDEMRTGYATLAGSALDMSLIRYIKLNDPVGPLYDLLVAGFCRVFGNSDALLRLPSLFFMSMAIPAFGILSRRFLHRGAAFAAVLFFIFSMNTLYFAQEARPYAMLLCWSLFTYLLVTLEPGNPRRRSGLFALAFTVGMYTHIVFAFVIANCLIYEILFAGRKRKLSGQDTENPEPQPKGMVRKIANLSPAFKGAAFAGLAYLPWFLVMLTQSADPARTPDVTQSLGKTILVTMSGLLIGNAYAPMKFMTMAAAAALLLWLYGMLRFHTHRPKGRLIVMIWTFAPIILTFATFSLFRNVYNFFHFRYLLPVMPFLLLPMASGLAAFIDDNFVEFVRRKDASFAERTADIWLRPLSLYKFVYVFVVLVFVFCTAFNSSRYTKSSDRFSHAIHLTQHQDWRTVYDYFKSNADTEDIVILHGLACPAIKYYIMRDDADINYKCTNDIREITELHDGPGFKWLVYYRDLWQPEFFRTSTLWLKHLSQVFDRLPGLYGDIFIQGQKSFVLNNQKRVCFDVVKKPIMRSETIPDIVHLPCAHKSHNSCEGALIFTNPQQGHVLFINSQRIKGDMTVSINKAIQYVPFAARDHGYVDHLAPLQEKYDLSHGFNDTAFSASGNYGITFSIKLDSLHKSDHPVTDDRSQYAPFCFELKREKPLKYYDTSSEKEYGDYLLNWIRK